MIWPSWIRPAAIGAAVLVVAVLVWVYWPAPGPSPAEEALKQQNELLIKQNEKLAADAAARTAEANQLKEDANAEIQKIPALRARKRTARADDAARRDAISATSDDGAVDALRTQHTRARAALRAVRAAGAGTESDGRQPQPR